MKIDHEALPELQVHKTCCPSLATMRVKKQTDHQSIMIDDLANVLIIAEKTNNCIPWDKLAERRLYLSQPPIRIILLTH